MREGLISRLETTQNPAILVTGDIMLDMYVWGNVERISPEAPVQVLKIESEEPRPGGAGNVAANLSALGARVSCCGIVGDDANGRLLCRLLGKLRVDTSGMLRDKERPTTVKTRMIAHGQQLLRVDKEETRPPTETIEKKLLERINALLPSCDAVLLSDYGKGTLSDDAIRKIVAASNKNHKPVLVDPARHRSVESYRQCTVLKPNRTEAALAAGMQITDEVSLEAAATRLLDVSKAMCVLVTEGSNGMTVFRKSSEPLHVGGLSRPVYDITGAGDTVLSLLGYVLAGGGTIEEAAEIANVAGSIVVGKLGAAPVTKQEIIRELMSFQHVASHKIKTSDEIAAVCREHRRRKEKIVFTNGCFDLLHVGHIKLFQFAKNNGEVLVVGLNSDASVRKLKGPSRPLLKQTERAYILSALEQIDYIVVFEETTPLKLIKVVKPDVLVKGADYTRDTVVGRDFVESYGGRVELAPLVEGASSSGIMSRIVNNKNIPQKS
ncbi:D-glycero-beta-D-manno-heptose-7-phosphate kinase [Candidatus Poribacteria bacterium]|nr:D-glycero-beta-D-manno-heptose-7-phosphate kinase [Candidatus Poribacteria bacterium]